MADYDAIVIGSGAGGLSCALSLARAGKRVAVYEQHYLPGGWCHTFPLGGFNFSPGVHYIGALGEGQMMRRIYEGLGVADDLTFFELNPDGFDHVFIGDRQFDIPRGRHRFADRLKAEFPHEAEGIDGYVETIWRIHRALSGGLSVRNLNDLAKMGGALAEVARFALMRLDKFLDRFVRDPELRAILTIQAGDYGLPPSRAPVAMHAAVVGHYFEGGFYPMGGGRAIPRAFIKALKKHGGEIHLETPIVKILTEPQGRKRKVVGVRLGDGTEVSAPVVVSNADPHRTYVDMIGREHLGPFLKSKLDRTPYSVSSVSLFFAAEVDAAEMGLDSGNYWYNKDADLEETYRVAHSTSLSDIERMHGLFLTVTSLKDRTKLKKPNLHTMEAFTLVNYDAFGRWSHTKYGERPESYETMKAELTDAMLAELDRRNPGLRDRVVFKELGTPLSNEYYAAGTKGHMYGTAKTRGWIGPMAYSVKSPFEGLYMCGASTVGHGVAGATASGLIAASTVLGAPMRDILSDRGTRIELYPADEPQQWPESLRRRIRVEDAQVA